ncbi:MAG: hypothetical protein Q9203_002263 [Teloschistes exilis]
MPIQIADPSTDYKPDETCAKSTSLLAHIARCELYIYCHGTANCPIQMAHFRPDEGIQKTHQTSYRFGYSPSRTNHQEDNKAGNAPKNEGSRSLQITEDVLAVCKLSIASRQHHLPEGLQAKSAQRRCIFFSSKSGRVKGISA